jgi:thiol:disulfide interchange protein DsbD
MFSKEVPMNKRKILYLCLGISFFLSSAAFSEPVTDAHTQVELITDVSAIQPGRPFWIGLHMDMEGQWQTYWKNPGDSGLSTAIKWDLPEGFVAGEIQWPFPIRMDYPEITSYGYEGQVVLLSEITPPASLEAGSRQTIKAHVTWLACGNICVPGKADLSLELPVQDEEPLIDESIRKIFDDTRKNWPLEISQWTIGAYDEGVSLRLHLIPLDAGGPTLTQAVFFPERNDLIDHKAQQTFEKTKNGYQLTIPKSVIIYSNIMQVKGVLVSPEAWEGEQRALSVDESLDFEGAAQ